MEEKDLILRIGGPACNLPALDIFACRTIAGELRLSWPRIRDPNRSHVVFGKYESVTREITA